MKEPPPLPSRRKRLSVKVSSCREGIAAELVSVLESVTADGKLTDDEVRYLKDWLDTPISDAPELPGLSFLRSTIQLILEDGVITAEEKVALYKAVEKVLPPDLRRSASERRRSAELIDRELARAQKATQREEETRLKKLNRPICRFNFLVAGVLYEGRAAMVERYAESGSSVFLIREPDNSKDPNAVIVRLREGYDIGYVPREEAAVIARFLDARFLQAASITQILRGRRAPIPVVEVRLYDPASQIVNALPASLLPARVAGPSGCLSIGIAIALVGILICSLL